MIKLKIGAGYTKGNQDGVLTGSWVFLMEVVSLRNERNKATDATPYEPTTDTHVVNHEATHSGCYCIMPYFNYETSYCIYSISGNCDHKITITSSL
jgi:hypothetical protein